MISLDSSLNERYTGTYFGVLVVRNFQPSAAGRAEFARFAAAELAKLRERFAGYDRKQLSTEDPVIAAYVSYYKRFKKSYHVLHQIESALAGKDLPEGLPLIQALFLTELQSSLLLAAHDLAQSALPFEIFAAEGGESYLGSGGREISLKTSDIAMRDQAGPILSIIYGQDERTRITERSSDALYLIDGVPGIEQAQYQAGLEYLRNILQIFQPDLEISSMELLQV
jgi:DNA/RNA-binding domain of Phe-tRNA-synthetase-like protein